MNTTATAMIAPQELVAVIADGMGWEVWNAGTRILTLPTYFEDSEVRDAIEEHAFETGSLATAIDYRLVANPHTTRERGLRFSVQTCERCDRDALPFASGLCAAHADR